MNKHTPGPWWRDEDGFIAAGSGESYVTIADFDCSDLDIDEREANKVLAIEAPAMLAALRISKERFEWSGDIDHPAYWDVCSILARIDGGAK